MQPYTSERQSAQQIADTLAVNVVEADPAILDCACSGGAPATFSGAQGTYYVRLDSLRDRADLRVDAYGAWGRATQFGHHFYAISGDEQTGVDVTRIKQAPDEVRLRKAPEHFDVCVKYNSYRNPSSFGLMHKTVFEVFDASGAPAGPLAAVAFWWDAEPFDFQVKPTVASASVPKATIYVPYQPTDSSVGRSHLPAEAVETGLADDAYMNASVSTTQEEANSPDDGSGLLTEPPTSGGGGGKIRPNPRRAALLRRTAAPERSPLPPSTSKPPQPDTKTGDDLFGMQIAESLKTLTPKQNASAKVQMQNLLYRVQFGDLSASG